MKLSAIGAALFLLLAAGSAAAVPVAPNESAIEGVVLEYSIVSSKLLGIEPEQTVYALTVLIERSTALKGRDRLKDKMAQTVKFYSKEKIEPELFGRKIAAKTSYRGDERGGRFWIYEIRME